MPSLIILTVQGSEAVTFSHGSEKLAAALFFSFLLITALLILLLLIFIFIAKYQNPKSKNKHLDFDIYFLQCGKSTIGDFATYLIFLILLDSHFSLKALKIKGCNFFSLRTCVISLRTCVISLQTCVKKFTFLKALKIKGYVTLQT